MFQPSGAYRKILIACIFFAIIICFNLIFVIVKNNFETYSNYIPTCSKSQKLHLELCPITPPHLIGEFSPDLTKEPLESVENRLADSLESGGYYKPKHCISRDRSCNYCIVS